MLEHTLLCLKCRRKGHIVNDCEMQEWQTGRNWMFSDVRFAMKFDDAWSTEEHALCKRCEDLDLIEMLKSHPPWKSQTELKEAVKDRHSLIRNLGKSGTIQFWEDCNVCRCLFNVIPRIESEDQEVLLIPDWTMCRLAGEFGIDMNMEEKGQYASCLISTLLPQHEKETVGIAAMAHKSDALCLVADGQRTLCGRKITHDMRLVDRWISNCTSRHGSECAPVLTKELRKIRLIDVDTRQVINYPGDCEYIALSYVCGDTVQKHYQLGSKLFKLPQTLEDAISYTKALHKRYLWVDALCIDQSNKKEKYDQINRMWSIYRGAYVTIIALAGTSADSGLNCQTYSQATCVIKGQRLVGLMPTVTQQILECPWGRRAWTLQEGLLSPRCLFISGHQMYFDCNIMRCCESLNEDNSWGHSLGLASNTTDESFVSWMKDKAGWGVMRSPLSSLSDRLGQWGIKVNIYSYRDMTLEEDAIRAFYGILQQLESLYPQGFHCGLPAEDMNWGLAWTSREPSARRELFPSWSWAGWKGPIWFGEPPDLTQTRRCPIGLQIHVAKDGNLNQIFESRYQKIIANDPIDQPLGDPEFELDHHPLAEDKGYLFIVGTCFEFALDFNKPVGDTQSSKSMSFFEFPIRGSRCIIAIQSLDQEISKHPETRKFLLLARDTMETGILSHFLLLLKDRGDVFERGTVLELRIPEEEPDVLEELKPQSRCIVLA